MLDSHTFELAYVFGHNGTEALPDERAKALSSMMIGYWTNFARHGDPNRASRRHDLPFWPKNTVDGPAILSLRDDTRLGADVRSAHQCLLWDKVDPEGVYPPAAR